MSPNGPDHPLLVEEIAIRHDSQRRRSSVHASSIARWQARSGVGIVAMRSMVGVARVAKRWPSLSREKFRTT